MIAIGPGSAPTGIVAVTVFVPVRAPIQPVGRVVGRTLPAVELADVSLEESPMTIASSLKLTGRRSTQGVTVRFASGKGAR